jgi:hypothetical protein
MSKITKQQFFVLGYQAENRDLLPVLVQLVLGVAYRHISSGKWIHGKPIELYMQDDVTCIRYQDGQWWHHDVVKGEWY